MSVPFIEEHLRALRLPTMLQNYKRLAQGDDTRITYLGELSSLEVNKRHENGVRSRIVAAKFPVIKTMESFDFSLQPELPRRKLSELLDRKFIEEKRNVIFIGKTGVGKTLLMSLIAAKRADRLKQRLRTLERCDFLAIDELGYIPFEREATDLLFQVISNRYERGSIGITTNLAFPDWTQVFPDAMAASAVVDRLIHHGVIFELTGESHRLRSRKKASGAKQR